MKPLEQVSASDVAALTSALRVALDAHADAQSVAATATAQSMDSAASVFEMGGILARLAR